MGGGVGSEEAAWNSCDVLGCGPEAGMTGGVCSRQPVSGDAGVGQSGSFAAGRSGRFAAGRSGSFATGQSGSAGAGQSDSAAAG